MVIYQTKYFYLSLEDNYICKQKTTFQVTYCNKKMLPLRQNIEHIEFDRS